MQNISEIGAPKLAQHVMETTGRNCHSKTVRRISRKDGFHIGLEKEIDKNLFEFARYYINKYFEFWKRSRIYRWKQV